MDPNEGGWLGSWLAGSLYATIMLVIIWGPVILV